MQVILGKLVVAPSQELLLLKKLFENQCNIYEENSRPLCLEQQLHSNA